MTRAGIGQPSVRIEGRQKVRGAAMYASDHTPVKLLYAVIVGSPVAAGRIERLDTAAATALPGVVRILTRQDMPQFGKLSFAAAVTRLPMQTDDIQYEGEPVAIVLGETLEAAEGGARLVQPVIRATPPLTPKGEAGERPSGPLIIGKDETMGDIAAGIARAAAHVEQTYTQAARHHNPIEPSATVAIWEDGHLTLYDAAQHAYYVVQTLAAAFAIPPDRVRVHAEHTGGGFGCKGRCWPHQILAAAAARITGRPVKLTLTRAQHYAMIGYQPLTRQTVRLAADAGGRLLAIEHAVLNTTAVTGDYVEPATESAKGLYASAAIATRQRMERVNLTIPSPMRAPAEGVGQWALESAMDELSIALGVDPVDLRLANHAEVDPMDGRPWSSKKLREAYAEGARRFGWRERKSRPRQDGFWRLGYGMATCMMGTFRWPSEARVRMRADGSVIIETGTHDIGTGTPTVLMQVVADTLKVDPDRISVRWGDTSLPMAGPVAGSSATIGTGGAVLLAARDLKQRLDRLFPGVEEPAAAFRASGVTELQGEGRFELPNNAGFSADGAGSGFAMRTWGALFVEVGVDPDLGLVRLRRAVGCYSAGRIVNPKTARSQMIGGIVWGWGKATMEESVQEPVHARWMAKNLSNVVIPVNADIPGAIDVSFVDEFDEHAGPIGARGIGELGATGVDAAVANAIHDAIGVRIRDLPITPGKILGALSTGRRTARVDPQ